METCAKCNVPTKTYQNLYSICCVCGKIENLLLKKLSKIDKEGKDIYLDALRFTNKVLFIGIVFAVFHIILLAIYPDFLNNHPSYGPLITLSLLIAFFISIVCFESKTRNKHTSVYRQS